jgi:threonine dehydrogenase-like Zn-dependent dehydrogenase
LSRSLTDCDYHRNIATAHAMLKTVRAAVIPAPGHAAEVRELPVPELEPDSALLQVELSEVCGTDVHLRAGRLSGVPYPLIPGHVSVGRLSAIRGTMMDAAGHRLREGDVVTFLDVHRTCHACWYCLVAKASTRCPNRRVYGITYGAVDGLAGGWAEAVYLKPGTRILPLNGVEPALFMAGGCALPTALHGVEQSGIMFGDTVLVLGSGPVGLSSIILARMRGAGIVLCIGAPAGRLEAATAVGANAVLDFTLATAEERTEWVRAHTGARGADVVIEATGAPAAVVDAMRCCRDAGRVIVLGQYTDHGEVAFNPHTDLNRKHLDVRGVWGSDYSHFHRGVELLRDPARAAAWLPLLLQRYSLADADRALDAVAQGAIIKALIDPAA